MAKNSSYTFSYDAPVTLTFVLASTLILALDALFFHGPVTARLLSCPAIHPLQGNPFDFKNGLDYLRMISHTLSNPGWETLLLNSAFLLLLGPTLEERYGSVMLLIMIIATSLISGVLLVCFGNGSPAGGSCIVFMLILLSAITAISKKNIQFSWILTFVLYTAYRMVSATRIMLPQAQAASSATGELLQFLKLNLLTFIDLFSGLVGSFFGFMVSPGGRSSAKRTSASRTKASAAKTKKSEEETYDSSYQEATLHDEETIGTIDL